MFKKTKVLESTLFETPSNLVRGCALNPKAWHNQFYELITSNIDEEKLKPLFTNDNMSCERASMAQFALTA